MLLNEGFKFGTSPILYSWVRSPCLSMVWYRPDARGDVRMLLTFLTGHEFLLPLRAECRLVSSNSIPNIA